MSCVLYPNKIFFLFSLSILLKFPLSLCRYLPSFISPTQLSVSVYLSQVCISTPPSILLATASLLHIHKHFPTRLNSITPTHNSTSSHHGMFPKIITMCHNSIATSGIFPTFASKASYGTYPSTEY